MSESGDQDTIIQESHLQVILKNAGLIEYFQKFKEVFSKYKIYCKSYVAWFPK